jgi:uncharacterized protein YbjQ (UPF0145 family)
VISWTTEATTEWLMFKTKTGPTATSPAKRITITTSDPNEPHEVLDIVRGVSVLASNVLKDTRESIRNLSGGDMQHYSSLIAASFDLARSRMEDAALALEADAVVTVRTQTVSLAEGAAEVICYGTAVRFVEAKP